MNALQHSLFEELAQEQEWDTDSWETPDWLAQKMAALVKPSDRRILEPAAGTGQIIKYLPKEASIWAYEVKYNRIWEQIKPGGLMTQLGRDWCIQHYSFLGPAAEDYPGVIDEWPGYDLIISNPPFSLCIEFIEQSLKFLNPNNSEARILFLLPIDWNSSVGRGEAFQRLDCHIHHEYRIMNRVAYLKNGAPVVGRQIYDAVFDIRLGKNNAAVTYL